MHILLVEPYFTGSHQSWATEYAQHSAHTVTLLTLPGRFWKWRMHGGAVTLAQKYAALPQIPDLILTTDMLDLTTFLALIQHTGPCPPCAIYFHENQLTYPWSPRDRDVTARRDKHYGFINYASALAADAVFFNSRYHMQEFFNALPGFLNHFPDYKNLQTIPLIKKKADVLPLGLDLQKFNATKAAPSEQKDAPPLILWNHRWEYDKNPVDFFAALYTLAEMDLPFNMAILGENFRQSPAEFAAAREKLGNRIIHFGYANDFSTYARLLWQADILPVTSYHDFFGMSVVQAMYCNCFPLLPNRLVYPGLLPQPLHNHCLYNSQDELVEKLAALIKQHPNYPNLNIAAVAAQFDWAKMAPMYDQTLAQIKR